MPELVVIEGQDVGKSFQVPSGTCTIGSGTDNTIALSDRRIASQQARIQLANSRAIISNLEENQNLLVNGEMVAQKELQHGDMITIGDTIFLFSEDEPAGDDGADEGVQTLVVSDFADPSIEFSKIHDMESVLLDISSLVDKERHLTTLYKVSNAINAIPDTSELLSKILEIIFEQFPRIDRGVVLLFDKEHARFIPKASRAKDHIQDREIKVSRTILKTAYEKRESILSNDTMYDERFKEGMSIAEQNIHSAMCVPLIHNQEVIGFIHVDSLSSGQAFNKDQLNFLTAIAMQSAVAISNTSGQEKNKEYIKKLMDLGKATQDLSYHLQKYPIIRSLGKYLFKILHCRHCMLALLNEKNKLSFTPYVIKSQASNWDENQVKVIKELCQQVVMNNNPILVSDLTFDPSIYFEDMKDTNKVESFLIVPIPAKADGLVDNPAMGAICISEKASGGAFIQEDQQLLTILANQVGIALSNAELYERATVDSLTRVFVRRYFFQRLEIELEKSLRTQNPMGLLMMDLDHFKIKNDTYGHQAGDYVLKETGKILKKSVRSEHVVARYGGEEFSVILMNSQPEVVEKIAERIRSAIETHKYVFEGTHIPCTVSVGMSMAKGGDDMNSIIKRADEALYAAKDGGRNQVRKG